MTIGEPAATPPADAHSRHSVLRERIVEHLFVAALLQGLDRLSLNLSSFWMFDDFESDLWINADIAQASYNRNGDRKTRPDAIVLKKMDRLADLDALLVRPLGDSILCGDPKA